MDQFLVHERPGTDGQVTHALVIGVGAYPHLPGGGERTTAYAGGMGQLTSPPVSARRVAEWLISYLDYPTAPLATVSLLLSEHPQLTFTDPATGEDHDVALATSDNVTRAVWAWKARGDTNPGNRLLFYFCGHGVAEGPQMTLLLRDYGENAHNPLKGALDFSQFHIAMDQCCAREQIFFVDACRASLADILHNQRYAGEVPILAGQPLPGVPKRKTPVYYSTLAGMQAYGRPNGLSPFTKALLASLSGAGSDNRDGTWKVDTSQLQRAIHYFMKQEEEAGTGTVQVPITGDMTTFEVHYLRGEPEVPVVVSCLPKEALARAVLRCVAAGKPAKERQPDNNEWELALSPGDYNFSADLADGAAQVAAVDRPVWPPLVKVAIPVGK
jgi:hypothetical protein